MLNVYTSMLAVHSWLRWLVVILAVWVILSSLMGWLSKKNYSAGNNRVGAIFIASMHTQLLIGLILYFFLSPLGLQAFENGMGSVMKNGSVRYWAVEHITIMIVAVVLAQIGRSRSKKLRSGVSKHKTMFIFTLIAFVLMMSRIPWDQAGRLFRGF